MDPQKHRRSREPSSISFPYVDLYAAIEVAQAISERSHIGACDLNELAKEFGDAIGGAFRLKTSAARIFELIEKRGRSEVRLTESGRQVLTEGEQTQAKARAFLRVPLYHAIFEKFKGSRLPQRRDLEAEMKNLGVPVKQVDKARQVFERSARQAGYFETSDSRLVLPRPAKQQIGHTSVVTDPSMMDSDDRLDGFPMEAAFLGRYRRDDPLIVGLIDRLPASGSAWTDDARIAWLKLANSIFNVTYTDGSGQIDISVGDAGTEPETL